MYTVQVGRGNEVIRNELPTYLSVTSEPGYWFIITNDGESPATLVVPNGGTFFAGDNVHHLHHVGPNIELAPGATIRIVDSWHTITFEDVYQGPHPDTYAEDPEVEAQLVILDVLLNEIREATDGRVPTRDEAIRLRSYGQLARGVARELRRIL